MKRIAASLVVLTFCASGARAADQPKTDVRVVNTPAESVPVAVQGGVQIVNPTTAPVVVRDTRQPFQKRLPVTVSEGRAGGSSEIIWVPPGQRIVIQHVAMQALSHPLFGASARLQVTNVPQAEFLHIFLNLARQEFALDLDPQVDSQFVVYQYVANHPVLAYADPGASIMLLLSLERPLCSETRCFGHVAEVVLSGYTEQVQ